LVRNVWANLKRVAGKDPRRRNGQRHSWKAATLISVQGRAQMALHESNVGAVYCTIGVDIFPEV